jgi:glycosyltransferase involved in cell wall biosynthesis
VVCEPPAVSDRPRASVIVATRERGVLLAATLARVVGQLGDGDELLVVESGAGDAAGLVAELGPRARHLRAGTGKCVQLNAAARAAVGEVLVLTDDDVDVPDGWVDAMAAAFTGAPRLGAAFGPVVGLSGVPGGTPAPVLPPGPGPIEVWLYAHGAAMAVRRAALFDVGGFDERLGPGSGVGHGEEADLVLRLRSRGWTANVADAPAVRHVDWRSEAEHAANVLVYERGAGIWVGAALRRSPRRAAKVAVLRLRYQAGLFRDRGARGAAFGPRTAAAFAGGVAAGLRLRPARFLDEPEPDVRDVPPARSARLRVLWVTAEPPGRDLGGGHIRQAHLVEGLAARAEVTVLSAGAVRDPAVRAAAAVIEVPAGRVVAPRNHLAERIRNLWVAVVARQPLEVWVGRRHRRTLRPVLDLEAPRHDVVALNHQVLYPLLASVPGTTRVLETQNVAAARARQHAAAAPGRRQRWLWSREAAVSRRFEDRAIALADAVVVCSEEDAADVAGVRRERSRGPVIVAPNGVDLDAYRPSPLPADPVVVLTATLDYLPNVDGARWFADEVLPLVVGQFPAARLVIAGRRPAPAVEALAERPGIEVHPDVPSVAPFIRSGRACVVPIRVGTGTRLKALEYLASGRPVVGTTIGLAGLGVRHGEQVLVADDAASFAAAVIDVLRDDALASRLAAAGRAHVEAGFSWADIARRHAAALESIAARQPLRRA